MSEAAGERLSVLIIGSGLIGTSIGLALSARNYVVHLADRHPSHALVAAHLGAGTVEAPETVDLVIVAVPPLATAEVIVQALIDHPGACVTDVASVKAPILEQVGLAGADLSRYVGSHPMAGSHRVGPLPARADLFYDRTWVITAHPAADPARVEVVRQLALACGAKVEWMDAAEHDLAVAEVSHVPQILSSLMAANLIDVCPSHLQLAGQGVRDVTRIAASDETLWTQITLANQAAIDYQLAKLAAALEEVRNHLDSPVVLGQFFRRGAEGTRALPGKRGRTPADFRYLVVEIPDSRGALARLFAEIEAAGVNVEDLGIEHDPIREVGYMSIAVEADNAAGLAETIAEGGWVLRS